MAKSNKELEGWEIITKDQNGNIIGDDDTHSRRSRRGRGIERHYLRRKSDAVQFGCGDNVIFRDASDNDGEVTVYFIFDIRLNTLNNLVEVWAFNYLKWHELDAELYYKQFHPKVLESTEPEGHFAKLLEDELDKKELFFALQHNELQLTDFVSLANIMDMGSWIDPKTKKNASTDFFVRYICLPDGSHFVPIDMAVEKETVQNMKPKEAEEHFKDILFPQSKSSNNIKSTGKKKGTVSKGQPQLKKIKIESDSSFESEFDSGEDEDDNSDAIDDSEVVDYEDEEDADEDLSENADDESENQDISDVVEEEEKSIRKRRGRPKKIKSDTPTLKVPHAPKTVKVKAPMIRKFTKKNVARAKKKYTPFSKRYKSIKDVPDLTKLAEFNQKSTEAIFHELETKLNTTKKHKIVETIFSKVKKQLYSSHGKEEIVKAGNFDDYLPARENEFASIYLSVYSAIESGSATTVYVAGTPGVGKTLTVREVIRELQYSVQQEELPVFHYVEINGLKMVKPTDSYEVLWNRISGERLTWGAAMESLEFYFSKVPKVKKRPIVVLLDELDALINKNQDIMYNFFNWTTYENANLIVIAVANTMDLPERQLGNKVSSRIGFTRIMFSGYTHEELKNIIDFRLQGLNNSYFYVDTRTGSAHLIENADEEQDIENKLPPGIKRVRLKMSTDAIEIASRKVASVSGDARRALKVCKRAVEIAEQRYMAKHGYAYDGQKIVDGDDDTPEEKETDVDGNEVEAQTVQISHIMKALNETINTNSTTFITRLSFTAKLFLHALLNLAKKTGLQEQSLGDVVDEIKLVLDVNGNNKFILGIAEALYQKGGANVSEQLRIISWDFVMGQLIEAGVLIRQNMKNERISCVRLNISEEDVLRAIEQDETLKGL
ncbi:hypothetical protein KAFR_0I00380 [Kazachstania africana CBS 2517]|uniref:Origin recognition complex subunit 1 n=1 Tax=Kazachstania africana (strain ATCC 22294 / BCRC 22015 / CBS 2517 / CECT 1963 / NBRC 1671 / NRRL Y-8276) TaxID=1071382 RepID=H2AZL9_KAZAF|nr:hypothetical protein KAFR_0I00380 [Kazachstania africana CBS 2517]CCF59819.1 hypothetical protein KAFR_0I00380 [Kazachstania africana CBS 2517]